MWKCLNCNTENEQEVCSVCGKRKEEMLRTTNKATRTLIICLMILLMFLGAVLVCLLLAKSDAATNARMAEEKKPTQQVVINTPTPVEPQIDAPSEIQTEYTQYFTYHNAYGGFSVDVLTSLKEESSDSAGVYYASPDGSVTMDIGCWEAGRVFNGVNALYDHIKSGIAYDINYDRKKDNWFVISGEDSGVIYYQYHILKPNGIACHFIITYPKSHEKEFDEIVTHIYHSFKME